MLGTLGTTSKSNPDIGIPYLTYPCTFSFFFFFVFIFSGGWVKVKLKTHFITALLLSVLGTKNAWNESQGTNYLELEFGTNYLELELGDKLLGPKS